MKSTSTTSVPACTGNLIYPLRTTILPSKLTKGELQVVKFSVFKPSPLQRSRYIILAALPQSIITLFTLYPQILRVTTKSLSCGCMVPCLSAFEKLNTSRTFILTRFGIELKSSSEQQDTDIILEGQDPILPRAVNMKLWCQEEVLAQHFHETPSLFGYLGHWSDARDALTSLLGPIVPNDPTNFCNFRQCVHDPDDNGKKVFGCDSQDLLPSYSAI